MCQWGNDALVNLCEPTPVQGRTTIKVDSCIAPLVQILNDYGVKTIASCCGHGKVEYSRIIIDARSVQILPKEDGSLHVHLIMPYKKEAIDEGNKV